MKKKLQFIKLIYLRHDLPAGLSVFLVALPLCLGIALASGAPLYSGLVSGIIGGTIVALISNSQLGVSGPAAGLSTVVAAAIASLGDYQLFLLSVIIAGVFQIILGILKLGVIGNYFPSAVIKGMLAAIGIILVTKQIPLALGYNEPDFWNTGFGSLFTEANFGSNFKNFSLQFTRGTLIISITSIALLIALQKPFAKKLKIIPAPLLVVLVGVLINYIFNHFSAGYSLRKTQLVEIPSNIFSEITYPKFDQLFSNIAVWKIGITIGLLATLETLLGVEAVDKLDKKNRITPINRELIAQGTGNILCGLFGAIPITAVIVRGAANADAGAKSKFASFTHGMFLLLAVLLVPFVLNQIPYASLAAILIITGYNLAKPKLFINMWGLGLKQFLPFIITIVVILLTDLLVGVFLGLLISTYFIIQNNFKAEYKINKEKKHETEYYSILLNSNVTFLNKVELRKTLDRIPAYSVLIIDGSACNFIDYDILEIISEFEQKAKDKHIEVHLNKIEKVNVTAIH